MWAETSVFYQIYPLGFCGAPAENDGLTVPRIRKVVEWAEHIRRTGANAVYFSPVFQSDRHGYDTRDYRQIDCRLGTNRDFADVCDRLHQLGIRVVLDGVFNHVGRGFWAFQDVLNKRENSTYKDWFFIRFGQSDEYNDGFSYDNWEGHSELVKLNVGNPEVREHLFSCIRGWAEEFGIDGLRLDVAYCIDRDFLRRLREFCDSLKPEFFLVGEMLFGDYNQLVNESALHSCTNYECYKGLYSSFNERNLFEISYSLNRQFGPETWCLYREKHLLCFADNHDVTRIASLLKEKRHLPLVYAVLFGMPGIPCVYYGSEWGAEGVKGNGSDDALRPCFEAPQENELTERIARLAEIHKTSSALCFGSYRNILVTNRQFIFERAAEGERILVAVNLDEVDFDAHFDAGADRAKDLLTGQPVLFGGGCTLPAFSAAYWKIFS